MSNFLIRAAARGVGLTVTSMPRPSVPLYGAAGGIISGLEATEVIGEEVARTPKLQHSRQTHTHTVTGAADAPAPSTAQSPTARPRASAEVERPVQQAQNRPSRHGEPQSAGMPRSADTGRTKARQQPEPAQAAQEQQERSEVVDSRAAAKEATPHAKLATGPGGNSERRPLTGAHTQNVHESHVIVNRKEVQVHKGPEEQASPPNLVVPPSLVQQAAPAARPREDKPTRETEGLVIPAYLPSNVSAEFKKLLERLEATANRLDVDRHAWQQAQFHQAQSKRPARAAARGFSDSAAIRRHMDRRWY